LKLGHCQLQGAIDLFVALLLLCGKAMSPAAKSIVVALTFIALCGCSRQPPLAGAWDIHAHDERGDEIVNVLMLDVSGSGVSGLELRDLHCPSPSAGTVIPLKGNRVRDLITIKYQCYELASRVTNWYSIESTFVLQFSQKANSLAGTVYCDFLITLPNGKSDHEVRLWPVSGIRRSNAPPGPFFFRTLAANSGLQTNVPFTEEFRNAPLRRAHAPLADSNTGSKNSVSSLSAQPGR
jgi:hypothetical protein